jgi:hypothetical protein
VDIICGGVEGMGRFTGSEVVSRHQQALRNCKGKAGWDLLACIVDNMQSVYGKRGVAGL